MSVIAVVAISARMLAEAAHDDGFEVVALDLFGDADTRRASTRWIRIGDPASLRIDGALLLSALESLARRGDVTGWTAGAGFEGRPDLLERGAALLRLIGTQAGAMRRVREPEAFFGFLAAQGIAHPETHMLAPQEPEGWLVKDAHGCGGWHIHRAAHEGGIQREGGIHSPGSDHRYFQREVPGRPMSATYLATGFDVAVLGFNQLIVRPLGGCPFVFCGAVGPVPLGDEVAACVVAAVRAITTAFSLSGLGSLDFMLDGDKVNVLEVNPRPPASMALYRRRHAAAAGGGVVAAHVRACLDGELPPWPAATPHDTVQGTEVVFATRRLRLDAPAAQRLAARTDCHDLPANAVHMEAGEPLCSVSASGTSADEVCALLQRRRDAVHESLETST